MAKEHFKFEFQEWMAEELIPETTGKIGMKQCAKYPLWEVDTIERVAMFIAPSVDMNPVALEY